MSRPRKFDWDEAARLSATGLSNVAIAIRLGVSDQAVGVALNSELRERTYAKTRARLYAATCPDCGGERNHYHARCRDCDTKAKTTSVRGDLVQCMECRAWLPSSQFARSRSAGNRGFHSQCRECNTKSKRDWRNRNREKQRAYDRARYYSRKLA